MSQNWFVMNLIIFDSYGCKQNFRTSDQTLLGENYPQKEKKESKEENMPLYVLPAMTKGHLRTPLDG